MLAKILEKVRLFNYRRAKEKEARVLKANLEGLSFLRKPNNPFYEEANRVSLIWEDQLKRLKG